MIPKEKAESLVDRMYFIISNNGQFTGVHSIPNKFTEAKKCALIAVDEEIKSLMWLNLLCTSDNYMKEHINDRVAELQEVKQEIEKL